MAARRAPAQPRSGVQGLLRSLEERLALLTNSLNRADIAEKSIDIVKEIKELHAILGALDAAAAPAPVASAGELKVTIPSGAPVEYVRSEPRKLAFASYTGYMAELDNQRNALRAWAVTAGHEVVDRPFESWKSGVDGAFEGDG